MENGMWLQTEFFLFYSIFREFFCKVKGKNCQQFVFPSVYAVSNHLFFDRYFSNIF